MSPDAKRRVVRRVTQSGALPVSRDAPGYAAVLGVLGVVDSRKSCDAHSSSLDGSSKTEGSARAGETSHLPYFALAKVIFSVVSGTAVVPDVLFMQGTCFRNRTIPQMGQIVCRRGLHVLCYCCIFILRRVVAKSFFACWELLTPGKGGCVEGDKIGTTPGREGKVAQVA